MQIVFLLQQSLAQNYTMNGPFLNSTVPFPPSATFEPPIWALRVNGLWFASLICSLATASIGMLVKQWPREYLAMEWISPQERLRARQFRNPGMKEWKVFEIAAALPLLLHVSLGLFFLGLCFFTASVDKRIGQSTLPLILAWAFFVGTTVIAPLVSPRCPFKVTLLKDMMRSARQQLMYPVCGVLHQASVISMARPPPWISRFYTHLQDEEEEMIKKVQDDVDILLSVDEIMVDDGLLGMMWYALKQERPSLQVSMEFVLGIIKHRLGAAGEHITRHIFLRQIIDLSPLSKRVWEMSMGMIGQSLLEYCSSIAAGEHIVESNWTRAAFHLFRSKHAQSLPKSVITIFANDVHLANVLRCIAHSVDMTPQERMRLVRMAFDLRAGGKALDSDADTLEFWTTLNSFKHSEQTWSSMIDVVTHLFEENQHLILNNIRGQRPSWAADAAMIFLSNSHRGLTSAAVSSLHSFLAAPSNANIGGFTYCAAGRLIAHRIMPTPDAEHSPLSSRFITILLSRDRPQARSCLMNVLHFYITLLRRHINEVWTRSLTLWKLLHEHPELFKNSRARPILEDLWTLLYAYAERYVSSTPMEYTTAGLEDGRRAIMEFGIQDRTRAGEKLQDVFGEI